MAHNYDTRVQLSSQQILRLLLLCLVVMADSTYDLTLRPAPELIVFEGGNAVVACSPFLVPASLGLALGMIEQGLVVLREEPRLTSQDFLVPNSPFTSNRTYTLRDVSRRDDSTQFVCVLGDLKSNEVTLRVYVPPKLSGPSGTVYVMENSPITRTLHYEELFGLPPPHSFTWLLDGVPFLGNARVNLIDGNQTLSISRASRADGGSYQLTVVSDSGQASLELNLHITYNEFIQTPKNCTVESGETITLSCRHRFGLAYVWTTTAPLTALGSKVSLSANNRTLRYGPVDYTDHLLEFTCNVRSVDDENYFVSSPATLRVIAPPRVTSPTEVSVIEERDLEVILFAVHSYPPPSVTIYEHNERNIEFKGRVRKLANGSIRILNPSKSDAGEYKLTVVNERGSASASTILHIFCAPQIVDLSGPLVAQFDRAARIPCGAEVRGHPPPSYKWLYQDVPGGEFGELPSSRFFTDPESGVLQLSAAQYDDSGCYQCNASNSIGSTTVVVNLLVRDPPSPPLSPEVLRTGKTWALISWSPPSFEGGIGTISMYAALATPRPSNQSVTVAGAGGFLDEPGSGATNSSCVEFECELGYGEVPGNELLLNLTGLVPAISYSLVVFAFSNGSNLQSEASREIYFNTRNHVPGIGLVTSAIHGPGSANISWTLAFSGGLPVQQFHIEFRRSSSPTWIPAFSSREEESNSTNLTVISPEMRYHIVHRLESQENYVFRVAGSNELGMGDFTEATEILLSHHIGVPSPPSRPVIVGWSENSVTISINISKFGSELDFSLSSILILGGTRVSTSVGMNLPENYTLGEVLELTMINVTYRGDWRFEVSATNYLGSSLPSTPSLKARDNIQDNTPIIATAGIAVWSVMGVLNIAVMATSMVLCRVMSWETKKQKKSLARRLEMVRDQSESCPFSPRLIFSFGDVRCSPDGRSTNVPNTPGGPGIATEQSNSEINNSNCYSV